MAKSGWVWDGTQFVALTAPVGAFPNAVANYDSIAPNNPITGQIWNDVSTNTLKIWTGSSWISYAPTASPTFTGTVTASAVNISTADTATNASHYMVETGSDGVIRPKTLANVQAEVVSNTTMQSNIVSPTAAGSNGIRKITISTSSPTGGQDGDIWFVYV